MSDVRFTGSDYGTPLAWAFDGSKQVLLDRGGSPINKYLTKFSYKSKEEDDDECTLEYFFPNDDMFDLPYFHQDVIFHVQWGYILSTGVIIKSPTRKVAVRDVEREYNENGILVKLQCTDIISYLKNMANRKVAKYSKVDQGDRRGLQLGMEYAQAMRELNWAIGTGTFKVNMIDNNIQTYVGAIDKVYQTQSVKRPDGKIEYHKLREMDKKEFYKDYNKNKPQGPQNIAKSEFITAGDPTLDRALRAKMRYVQYQNELTNKAADKAGQIIVDGTDDIITVKKRDFSQPIWRSFTRNQDPGIIISFSSKTNTKLERKDISARVAVNPYEKSIEKSVVTTVDKREIDNLIDHNNFKVDGVKAGNGSSQTFAGDGDYTSRFNRWQLTPSDGVIRAAVQDINQTANSLIDDSGFSAAGSIQGFSYKTRLLSTVSNGVGPDQRLVDSVVDLPFTKQMLSPYINSFYDAQVKSLKNQWGAADPELTGYTIEKTIRKYEGTLKVLGDPSILKGKIISINNFNKIDNGKWYILEASHEITVGQSYTTEMKLMRNPIEVSMTAKTEISTIAVDPNKEGVIFNNNLSEDTKVLNTDKDDTTEEDPKEVAYSGSSNNDIENRIELLNAEEDFSMGKNIDNLYASGNIDKVDLDYV